MRIMMEIDMPSEPFNTMVREGTVGRKLGEIMEELQPEATYFTERDGHRCCLLVVDLEHSSDVPRMAEPFFLTFDADVHFRVCMTPEDLDRGGLDELGKRWG